MSRAGWSAAKFILVKIWRSSSTSGPSAEFLSVIPPSCAHALKYLYYLVLDNRERMASAELNGVRSTGKIRINIIISIAIGIANLFA